MIHISLTVSSEGVYKCLISLIKVIGEGVLGHFYNLRLYERLFSYEFNDFYEIKKYACLQKLWSFEVKRF